jgi:hypothetical protein
MADLGFERSSPVKALHVDRPGWGCLDASQIAAFIEQRLPAEEEARIEEHLADCAACLEQVVFLARHQPGEGATVPPHLLARARGLVATRPPAWRPLALRWGSVAAAFVLFAIAGFRVWQPATPLTPAVAERDSSSTTVPAIGPATAPAEPSPAGTAATSPTAQASSPAKPAGTTPGVPAPSTPPPVPVRRAPAAADAVVLLSPTSDSMVPLPNLEFRWRDVPNAIYYDLHVVTEEGDVVWQGRVEGTRTRLPDGHPLHAGTKYFVWVRAHLAGGGTLKSAAAAFRVGQS